jgi:hypothetical protein
LAGQVLLKIVFLLMRWLFSLAILVIRGDGEKSAELLVLRHENAVLRRNAGRIRYDPADRAWFAALTRFIPRRRWMEVFPVTSATLLAWHRRLTARRYDTSRRRKPGRPATICPVFCQEDSVPHAEPSADKTVGGGSRHGASRAAARRHPVIDGGQDLVQAESEA